MNQSLLNHVKTDFPEFRFIQGKKFAFRPPKTIVIGPDEPGDELLFLHELGHASLGHQDFTSDAVRLKLESAAWNKAREFSQTYHIPWNEEKAEAELDTYRDWLHRRSLCKKCGLTRYQTPDGAYHCPRCENFSK